MASVFRRRAIKPCGRSMAIVIDHTYRLAEKIHGTRVASDPDAAGSHWRSSSSNMPVRF
jgi:hypothetical protein